MSLLQHFYRFADPATVQMDGDGTWGIYGDLLIDTFRFQAGACTFA